MISQAIPVLAFAGAIGSALVAGVFFAFSSFVMAALGRLSPEQGIAAMQSINITVINAWFMLAFLGTGAVCVALAAGSYALWGQAGAVATLAASLIYLAGCIGVTMVCNVPLNEALAASSTGTPDAVALWSRYLTEWTFWNTVRTVATLASAILFTLALI